MKTLKVRKSFERFEVEVGDETVTCTIDCTDGNLNACVAKAMKARDEALALDEARAKTTDRKSLDRLARKMAGIVGGVVRGAIGDESYDEILTACGDGVKLRPEQCNLVMVQVFALVCQAYIERLDDVKQSKAAHYLQEVAHGQEPDDEGQDR